MVSNFFQKEKVDIHVEGNIKLTPFFFTGYVMHILKQNWLPILINCLIYIYPVFLLSIIYTKFAMYELNFDLYMGKYSTVNSFILNLRY